MTSKFSGQVREFMYEFKQATPSSPTVPRDSIVKLRLRLIAEEFCELMEACAHPEDANSYMMVSVCMDLLNDIIEAMRVGVDIESAVDAFADLAYVVEGGFLAFGVNSGPVLDEVHGSNMSKAGGPIDEHGKVRKNADWSPPDLGAELRKQGWTP